MKTYLLVQYPLSAGDVVTHKVDIYMASMNAQRVGSGMGLGHRDLEYATPTLVDQELLNAHAIVLRALTKTSDLALFQEAWTEEGEELEEVEEHCLKAA